MAKSIRQQEWTMEPHVFTAERLAGHREHSEGSGITVLSMHDRSAIGRVSRAAYVECRTCGYEPPSGIMPRGRCPKCLGYGWHYAMRYTALPGSQDLLNEDAIEMSNNEKGPIPA